MCGLILLALIGCASCSGGDGQQPVVWRGQGSAAAHAPVAPRLRTVWTSSGVRPVTAVGVIGSTALVYGQAGHRLYLYGLDASTGRVRWHREASTAATTPGVDLYVAEVDGSVAYFGPMTSVATGAARMIVADPSTGRTLGQSPPQRWTGRPHPCSDTDLAPCASAFDQAGAVTEYRLDVRRGTLRAVDAGYREVGEGLVDPLLRNPEFLEHRVNGETVWGRPLAALFDPGYSTDEGWDFEKFGEYYVGTVGRPLRVVDKYTRRVDLAQDLLTAGFGESEGTLWWQQHGTSVNCLGALSLGTDQPYPVRCRYTGTITYRYPRAGGVPQVIPSGVSVIIEGFDPLGSTATWSHRLGAAMSLVDGDQRLVAVSDQEVLLRVPAGTFVLNVKTGSLVAAPSGGRYWCQRDQSFDEAGVPAPSSGLSSGRIPHQGRLTSVCDAAGHRVTNPAEWPGSVPTAVSAEGPSGLRLVATADGVIAFAS